MLAHKLALAFLAWWLGERTLSIHTIYTTRREAFYWLVVFFTFALGAAGGDLIAERYSPGYSWALLLFAGAIALVASLHYGLKLNAVLSFWIAYILTRPLGASTCDLLASPRHDGGLELGTTVTSFVFLGAILIVVTYLAITKRDVTVDHGIAPDAHAHRRGIRLDLRRRRCSRDARAHAGRDRRPVGNEATEPGRSPEHVTPTKRPHATAVRGLPAATGS